MAKRLTIFYSWQSDSPSNLNRNFIEKALHEALKRLHSDATLENALRDATVELDKDTQGIAGSPPIAETILRKIEDCAVFVADLSFVGESRPGLANPSGNIRKFPNPNVLIEYGYALRCHSHSKLIGVMNTAYGEPNAQSLPFDLRHLRWPITYSSSADKNEEFEALVVVLVKAIGLILSTNSQADEPVEAFVKTAASKNAAVFFQEVAELNADHSEAFLIPDGAKAYLRLSPSLIVPPIESELEAKAIAVNGRLQPIGRVGGYNYDRNVFGSIVYESPRQGKLYHFTQLFLNRELWGVDAMMLDPEQSIATSGNQRRAYIANLYLETEFVKALHNYLMFSQTHLQISPPLQIEAGLVGIKGYPISVNAAYIGGKAIRDTIQWRCELKAYGRPGWEILAPFFAKIFDNCGYPRTAQHQDELIKQFVV